MCLIVFAWQVLPDTPLVLAANRDEFYARPTLPLHEWSAHPGIWGGQDLQAGGTWLGLSRHGRFAALTNYRDPAQFGRQAPSRGQLTTDFLLSEMDPKTYLESILPIANRFNGFNLLVGTASELWYLSNYEGRVREVLPGIYGLSNHLLDTPWYKVRRAQEGLTDLLSRGLPSTVALLDMMKDPTLPAQANEVQQTGLPFERERLLSPMFIQSPEYGTCSTSAIVWTKAELWWTERRHMPTAGEQQASWRW